MEMLALENKLVLEEKFGGFRAADGVEITSFSGGIDVFINGADSVGMDRELPKCKDRGEKEVAILAVLPESAERRAAMEDQSAFNNPYLVEVGVEVEPDDGQCLPASVPEEAVTLVMIRRYEFREKMFTQVTMFPPD